MRRGEGGQDVNVTNDPAQDIQPAFSPDGNSIAFVSTRSSRTGLIKIGGTLGAQRPDLRRRPLGRPGARRRREASGPRRELADLAAGRQRDSLRQRAGEPADDPRGLTRGGPPRAFSASENVHLRARSDRLLPGRALGELRDAARRDSPDAGVGRKPRALLDGLQPRLGRIVRAASTSCARSAGRQPRSVRGNRPDSGRVRRRARDTISLMTALPLGPRRLARRAAGRGGRGIGLPQPHAPAARAGRRDAAGPEEPLSTGRVTDAYPSVSPRRPARGLRRATSSAAPEFWILDLASGSARAPAAARRRRRPDRPDLDARRPATPLQPPACGQRRLELDRGRGWERRRRDSEPRDERGREHALSAAPDGKKVLYPKMVRGVQQVFALRVSLAPDRSSSRIRPETSSTSSRRPTGAGSP